MYHDYLELMPFSNASLFKYQQNFYGNMISFGLLIIDFQAKLSRSKSTYLFQISRPSEAVTS